MKSVNIHIETMQFQIGSIRGAVTLARNFNETNNQNATRMTLCDALNMIEKLENNLNALKNAQK